MIKTLIFDFGDVFINLNKASTLIELQKLGITFFTEEMLQINIQYETGQINTNTFVNSYLELFPNQKGEQLSAAWNAIILDFPEYRLEFIEELSKSKEYQLILLSNTNDLHIEKVIENMGLDRYERFQKCFDAFYLSQEIHFRKPNADIYEFVLNNYKLNPNECLFIDDTKENTDTAKELGIHIWNIKPETEDIIHLFSIQKELF